MDRIKKMRRNKYEPIFSLTNDEPHQKSKKLLLRPLTCKWMISTTRTMLGKAVSLTDRSISHNIADGGVMQLKYYFQTTTASNGIYIYWITNREYTERANEEEKPKEQTKKEKPQKEKDERVIRFVTG